ncbi:hypothetical protein PVAND_007553 [Polypedilum vanderplanki]|uniref:Uncharacterized protein n=1 Tax=Polypedilum vanderplanki TaxID=319348 RepID=A0A9J6C7B2_POLVA|nr:hypothetical protein PVAND_007553 [Polypedilum vanderplanki]
METNLVKFMECFIKKMFKDLELEPSIMPASVMQFHIKTTKNPTSARCKKIKHFSYNGRYRAHTHYSQRNLYVWVNKYVAMTAATNLKHVLFAVNNEEEELVSVCVKSE